ncbi:MAG: BamA/TamA family outer membrane protein [Chitinophagaceae bacterium]|nr:BamA/TamA family outer membrane protein [Chitinophagaceae bacterium]
MIIAKINKKALIMLGVLTQFIFSCNYTKHLTKSDRLLTANEIIINAEQPIKYKGIMIAEMQTLIPQQPNSNLFDVSILPKLKLLKYNWQFEKYKKDSLNDKIAKRKIEKPVLLQKGLVQLADSNLIKYMENKGYFYAKIKDTIIEQKNKKAKVRYTIDAGKSYVTNKIIYNVADGNVLSFLNKNQEASFAKKGKYFTKTDLGLERERLYKLMRENGYFDFKTENISFKYDTVNREKFKEILLNDFPFPENTTHEEYDSINVYVNILPTRDSNFLRKYAYKNIIVSFENPHVDERNMPFIENELDGIKFIYRTLPLNRNVISRNIFIHKNEVYSTKNVEATINRLNQIGVFQFVNIDLQKSVDEEGSLDCYIKLSMAKDKDIVFNSDVSTSEDYKLGLGGNFVYNAKNLFFGANHLASKIGYSTEFRQADDDKKNFFLNGNNFTFSNSLIFPKFILPFNQKKFSKSNLPFTVLSLGYGRINRVNRYVFSNITGTFGYAWKESNLKSWRVNPIFLTVTKVPEKSLGEAFKISRLNSQFLRNTFSDNVLMGENISFQYKSTNDPNSPKETTLRLNLEEAGALLSGINVLYKSFTNSEIEPIANYLRLDADLIHYKKYRKFQWVNRVMAGFGMPYADDKSLPYIKQYSEGGAFSNRGWRARTLGPGRYFDPNNKVNNEFIDITGDMKIEANTEFRFDLIKLFSGAINIKGATFIDAGNIWLYNEDVNRPGSKFNPSYFLQDIAISLGAGLRLDFSFFVFRVDLGFPIKKPYLTENAGFDFKHMKYNEGVWNVIIGYPF